MSSLKTGILILLALTALPAAASPDRATLAEPLNFFAACAGRLSAELEFSWLLQTPHTDEIASQRETMIALVHSLIGPEDGSGVLELRINAKMAHAALLTRATFNEDAGDAAWAAEVAARQTQACTELVLS